jgi:thioredoxin-like negative regulator of GroEL
VSNLVLSFVLQLSLLTAVSDNATTVASSATLNQAATSDTVAAAASHDAADSVAADHSAPGTYAAAYQDTQDSGKPLVVLVGASWCPACRSMKTSTMPGVAAQGGLANVAFAYVNTDAQSELAGQLMEGNMIPQLVMYEKTADGWKLTRLVGAQSVDAVQDFLRPAVAQAIAAKNAAQNPAVAAKPSSKPASTQSSSAAKQPTASHDSTDHSAAG